MMQGWFWDVVALLAMLAGTVLAADAGAEEAGPERPAAASAAATEPQPYLLKPAQGFALLKNWTFGSRRPDATIRDKADLDREFYYRYIWEGGKLDKFSTYWSYHRDYPEGDPSSLHVFSDRALTLKGRIPPGGGLHDRGIESGMLRAKIPVTPGMYFEMRAKLPGGVGVWPNFWLEQGVQHPDGKFSLHDKVLSEIDIFEFFNWDGRPETRIIVCNVQTFAGPAAYGNPHDIFTLLQDAGYERHLDLGFDCSKDFHVFALDWVKDKPIWLVDGKPIKQTYYEWVGPPAHVVVANSIGMQLKGVSQKQMVADEKQWDYVIDYIRIWQHAPAAAETLTGPTPYPRKDGDGPGEGVILNSFESDGGRLTVPSPGSWQNPSLPVPTSAASTLKANPVLKVDIAVPPDADDSGWFQVKLAIQAEGLAWTQSPQWLVDGAPGKAGIEKRTLSWDLSSLAAKLPANPSWFKIELVNQGDHPRTIHVSNLRCAGAPERPSPPADPGK